MVETVQQLSSKKQQIQKTEYDFILEQELFNHLQFQDEVLSPLL